MLRRGSLLLAWLCSVPACAQVSGSVTVMSDYRYDGVSLSNGAPTAQLALAWDRGDGWYGGVALTRVRFQYPGAANELQAEPYLGYVHVLRRGESIEAGAQYTWFSRSTSYRYPELYAAWSGERVRARVAWMPGYFGQDAAWYAQLDGTRPLRGPFHLLAHAGVLRQSPLSTEYADTNDGGWRYDVAAGIDAVHGNLDLQLTWTTVGGHAHSACVPWECGARDGWVLTLSRSW